VTQEGINIKQQCQPPLDCFKLHVLECISPEVRYYDPFQASWYKYISTNNRKKICFRLLSQSQDSIVMIMNRLMAGRSVVQISAGAWDLSLILKCWDWLWGPPSLLCSRL